MGARLGFEGKLYRNTGTYNVPVLTEVTDTKDLTLNIEKGEADATTRANGGWKAMLGALKDGSIDFSMVTDTTDTNWQAFRTSFYASTQSASTFELFIMNTDVDDSDSKGIRASFFVSKWTENQPLEEVQTTDITIRIAYSANAPAAIDGSTYAAYD